MKYYMRWRRKSDEKGKLVIGALAGVAAGLTAGLLAAPRSGRDTRSILSSRAVETFNRVGKNISRAQGK